MQNFQNKSQRLAFYLTLRYEGKMSLKWHLRLKGELRYLKNIMEKIKNEM